SADFVVFYDKSVFTIAASNPDGSNQDIQLGKLISSTPGLSLKAGTATAGLITITINGNGVDAFSGTGGGHLVDVTLHVQTDAPTGLTPLDLAAHSGNNFTDLYGQDFGLDFGSYTLNPAPTNAPPSGPEDGAANIVAASNPTVTLSVPTDVTITQGATK